MSPSSLTSSTHSLPRRLLACLTVIALLFCCLAGCNNSGTEEGTGTDSPSAAPTATASQDIPVGGDPSTSTGKRVALTFDDGPHNVRTTAIVDELSKYGYNATFFVLGNRVDGAAYNGGKTLSYIADAGNEIGIHGYTHEVYYNNCTESEYNYELSETAKAIRAQIPGYEINLMRPIGGAISDERIKASPYSTILWSVDSEDWKYKYTSDDTDETAAEKVNQIVQNVMSQVEDGDIILMHDIYESTYDAVVIILKQLHDQGYDVITVSELLGGNPTPGTRYSQAN